MNSKKKIVYAVEYIFLFSKLIIEMKTKFLSTNVKNKAKIEKPISNFASFRLHFY